MPEDEGLTAQDIADAVGVEDVAPEKQVEAGAKSKAEADTDTGVDTGPRSPQDWATQSLPPDIAKLHEGCQTWGDVHARYQEGSREVRRVARLNQQYQTLLDAMMKREREPRAAAAAAPGEAQPGAFFNWSNIREFNTDYAQNPRGAMLKLYGAMRAESPEQKATNQRFEAIEEENRRQHQKVLIADCYRQNPEFAPGTDLYNFVVDYYEKNPDLQTAINEAQFNIPDINWSTIMAKAALYDVLKARTQIKGASDARARAQAGTARPGTGARAKVKGDELRSTMDAVVEDMREAGHEVPDSYVEGMIEALEQHNVFRK